MELSHRSADGYTIISINGRLNMVSAPQLRQYVTDVVAQNDPFVVIDFAETDFMDSSGLGALVASLKVARQAGGDLRIASVQPQVRMVLELTSMDRILKPYASPSEAYQR
ncbi:STAS domain-containing protein [Jonesia quinghaiensis]|uniref:STAS domain-containing protein n=1 Tax=Jonesia quinghaiensis TaxID=262806 RepID=UPI0004207C8E|nr:STAS domain-containing protein [Jonesia quinghaiensis]